MTLFCERDRSRFGDVPHVCGGDPGDLCPESKLADQKRTADAIICHSNWLELNQARMADEPST
jgi:hypothetical protein